MATVQLPGCPFAPRCPYVMTVCHTTPPPVVRFERGQEAVCWLYGEEPGGSGD